MRQILRVKRLLIATILGVKLTMKIVTMKKPCFGQFCRFLNYPLTLKLLHTYIYVFRAFFGFFNFYASCCFFFLSNCKIILFYLKLRATKARSFGVQMYQCPAEQQRSPEKLQAFLQCFQTKERTLRLNEAKINSGNASNRDHFMT